MRTSRSFFVVYLILFFLLNFFGSSFAVWVWTPETGKFINPKYAVKDSPKEQYEYAMHFFETQDLKKAIAEFQKLINSYQYSEYAARAQYYIGRCHEALGNHFQAFESYQKVIDSYPYSSKNDEIIEREFAIAELFYAGQKAKMLGVSILPPDEKAIEVYKKVIANAPFGKYADVSWFKIGQIYQRNGRYQEAVEAFQRIVEEYPSSDLIEDARYQIAFSTYKASLKPYYDQETTDEAIEEFEGFVESHTDMDLKEDADTTLRRLKSKKAEKDYEIARFYEKRKKYKSAEIYYQNIIKSYPGTSFADRAELRLMEVQGRLQRSNVK